MENLRLQAIEKLENDMIFALNATKKKKRLPMTI